MSAYRTRPRAGRRRGGFTLVEVAVTAFLLAVALTLVVQTVSAVAAQRRSVERRQWAVEEVANQMERLAATPWDRLTPEHARGVSLSETARRLLPHAELAVALDDDTDGDVRKVGIRLRWRERSEVWSSPVRLTVWITRRAAR